MNDNQDNAPAGEIYRKFYVAETKTLRNGDVESYVTTASVDRMGDIILTDGWDISNYKKTGSPVLFGHEYSVTAGGHIPLIGNAVEIEVQKKGIWAVTRFHEKTQLSRDAALLAREKIMPNWSVGFNALEPPEPRMEGEQMKGFIFKKQELLEYSLVAVPANPDAVSKALFFVRKSQLSHQLASYIVGPSAPPVMGEINDEDVVAAQFEARQIEDLFRKRR